MRNTLKRWALPLYRIYTTLRASAYLRGCKKLGHTVRLAGTGRLRVLGAARITIADLVAFNQGPLPTLLDCGPEGEISIGTHTGFNYGVSLQSRCAIHIGCDCWFGAMVMVRDFNSESTAPVIIGDRVWIAHSVIVEPGVTIGNDSVISAGSVVRENVPPQMIAMGNPARCIPLRAWRSLTHPTRANSPKPGESLSS